MAPPPLRSAHSRAGSTTSFGRPSASFDSFDAPSPKGNGGLGSLADELAAEEWDEQASYNAPATIKNGGEKGISRPLPDTGSSLSPSFEPTRRRNGDHDGFDSGDEAALTDDGITPGLEKRLAGIEALARQGTGDADTKESGVIARVAVQLRDLSPQANVETQITRLVECTESSVQLLTGHRLSNASTAISGNLTKQSRTVATLAQPIFSPFAPRPNPEATDQLPAMLDELIKSLPQPPTTALHQIHSLHAASAELAQTLSQIADWLQIAQQTTNMATRRLRTATEAAVKLRRELDEAEEARTCLERRGSDEKLKRREASEACREVVNGFEAACERWREQLIKGAQTHSVEVAGG